MYFVLFFRSNNNHIGINYTINVPSWIACLVCWTISFDFCGSISVLFFRSNNNHIGINYTINVPSWIACLVCWTISFDFCGSISGLMKRVR